MSFTTQSLSSSLPPDDDGAQAELQAAFRTAATSIVALNRAGQRASQHGPSPGPLFVGAP